MTLFSQRIGIRPLTKTIQRESIDDDLKNRLWSALDLALWAHWSPPDRLTGFQAEDGEIVDLVVERVWLHYFKLPLDTLPSFHSGYPKSAYEAIRERFFTGDWWESYDLLEFLIKVTPEEWRDLLKESANKFLESENAAYRVVGDEVVEMTGEYEMEAVETALDKGVSQSRIHLSRSLELLSDRKQPDFRNSIKESISAVESASQVVSCKPKATLGDRIKAIKANGEFIPHLKKHCLVFTATRAMKAGFATL